MKILKRNQLIILVMALMLITAGYLNYTSDNNEIETSAIIGSTDATLGDATLVNANIYSNEITNEIRNEVNEVVSNEVIQEDNAVETLNVNDDEYFINSKLERTAMYSELLESYQELYNNTSASVEEKKEALAKINEINSVKNSIMIVENLIYAKGIEDLVIFVNDNSTSVVVGKDDLRSRRNCTNTKHYFKRIKC